MSVYVIVQGKIENRGLLDQYVAKVMPTIESHHGRVVAFDEQPEVIEGPIDHPRTVILQFPSMTAFHAWYDSSEIPGNPAFATEVGTRYAHRCARFHAVLR